MCVILIKIGDSPVQNKQRMNFSLVFSFSLFFSSSLLPTTKPGPHKYLYDHYSENSGAKLLFSRKIAAHTLHISKWKIILFSSPPKPSRIKEPLRQRRTSEGHLLEPTAQLVLPNRVLSIFTEENSTASQGKLCWC